jgi:tight adherence protein B
MGAFALSVVGVWVAAVVVWWLVNRYFRKADRDRMKERILDKTKSERKAKGPAAAPALIAAEDQATGRVAMRIMKKLELNRKLEEMIEQAGMKWRPARLVHTCAALFLAVMLACRLILGDQYFVFQLAGAMLASAAPLAYLVRVRRKRLYRFEEQFPESLEFVARSMRAGHAFSVSLEMIHREFQEPLASEFRRTFDEHNLGMPLDTALVKLAKRVPLLDVHFFVSAVMLQKRTGGNLAEILDKLAYVIRERFKLRGKIRAISAHGRMTGTALTAIPLCVALMMLYTNPEYISFFARESTGHIMAGVAIALQLVGYVIIRKIVQIEV